MIRTLFVAVAAAALACNTTQTVFAGGQFAAPTGLAVSTAADRDVLFVANAGQDNLRALQFCSVALLGDGGIDPADTCPKKEDQQFLPGPLRVFPAAIETDNRPVHLAGARLLQADGGATGALLAVGADTNVRAMDVRNLVDATHGKATPDPVMSVPLGSPVVDVVAINAVRADDLEIGSPTVNAFAVTSGPPALLVALKLSVNDDGGVAQPVITGQCTLDPVLPRRIAAAPGGSTVYIADGSLDGGDGVVGVAISSIAAGGACAMERIGTGLTRPHPTRAVAVSPTWYDDAGTHPPGELVMMVLEPGISTDAGTDLDPGGILIARTADKTVVPVPPNPILAADPGLERMQPITSAGFAREITFLPAVPPAANCNPSTDGGVLTPACTPLYVGAPSASPVQYFNLLAAVSSTTGNTYFIDVTNRRIVTSTLYDNPGIETQPGLGQATLSVNANTANPPGIELLDAGVSDGVTHPFTGWVTPGVTKDALWQVEWHATMPGLQTRGGTITPAGAGTMTFKAAGLDLSPWINDPILALRAGDVVGFSGYIAPDGAPQACKDIAASEANAPLRFEVPILGITLPDVLELSTFPGSDTQRAFNVDACPGGLGAAVTVRTGGAMPWLVLENSTPRGRLNSGDTFLATGQRYDYPLDYTLGFQPPLLSDDVAVAFSLSGGDPQIPGAKWTFNTTHGLFPVYFADLTITPLPGMAGDVITYRSGRRATQVLTAITGQNSVVQADPLLPLTNVATNTAGVITYK